MESPYARKAPSVQQTLDLFKGKWASAMPPALGPCEAGSARLFEDPRVPWAIEKLAELGATVAGSTVLELGPLEGAHTHAISQAGAAAVTAVEAHPEAYLKCLVAKELIGMQRVNFLFGDAVEFMRTIGHTYDVGFACGFLYHMTNPVEVLELLCKRTHAIFLWTVYWDDEFNRAHPENSGGAGPVHATIHQGFQHRLHRHDYGENIAYGKFWGGKASHAFWMEKDEILGALRHFGFSRQIVVQEENPNGSALRMVAARG
ncbi:class I SAM-dependent methyltransferase [Opitutaceae bacterium EW11]|nr:class I SAM-dependent methyltransferase [Opitutaceae bacterium EW11]